MNALFQITLVNAVCAALLAAVVALVGRYVKRPAVLHALWIVVLLQLFMPPVVQVGLLPRPASLQRAIPMGNAEFEPASAPGYPLADEVRSIAPANPVPPAFAQTDTTAPRSATPRRIGAAATAVWGAGTVWVLALVLLRSSRFRRLLRAAGTRDATLDRRLARLAARVGVQKPDLRLVHASISPLIRPRFGRAELLFPADLLRRLDAGEQEAILVHELAHVARRDHWVRLLELIAVSLFWWHPAVWWARARLRLVEERCCDQLVMQTLPRGRSSYARGLLKTVEFLAGKNAVVPALASGIGEVRDLKERLTMILKDRPAKSMSKLQRTFLALCAASVLLIFPTWSDRDLRAAPTEDDAVDTQEQMELLEDMERAYVNQRLELEQQAMELRRALHDVRERQAELERLWQSEMRTHELDETQIDTARSDAETERARALEMYERARAISRQAEREVQDHAWERDRGDRQAEIEDSLRRTMREADAALDRLRDEAYEHREAARTELAERIEAEIEALRARIAEERLRREREIRHRLEELERVDKSGTVH